MTSIRLLVHDGANGSFYDDYLMAAHTVAATTAQPKVTLIDRTDPTKVIRLESGWKVGLQSPWRWREAFQSSATRRTRAVARGSQAPAA